jgi:signal transduction histidine kinase/putative methionine-R-sulfoxide reductase with GAF domain
MQPQPLNEPLDMLQAILSQMSGASSLSDLLERTISYLHGLLSNTATAVFQITADGVMLNNVAFQSAYPLDTISVIPLDTGLIGATARSGRTILAPDTRIDSRFVPPYGGPVGSELCVPIVTRHGLWGVLMLDSEQVDAYPPKLVQVAEIVAQQLAIAVENTTLVDQAHDQAHLLKRHAHELSQILTLNSQLRVSIDMDALLQYLADSICSVMGFRSVIVNLVDLANNHVWVAAIAGGTDEHRSILSDATYQWDRFLGDDPSRFLVSHSYFIPAESGYETPGVYIVPELDARSPHEWQPDDMLIIPIADHRGEILGMLSVDDPKDRQRPSLTTIQGLEIFASQAAAAIENARLFAQTQTALNALREAHERQAQLLEDVRRTQSELLTTSKLAAVGTLAAGVAHEFNNLLAGMHGYAELGQNGTLADKDDALDLIRRTCLRGVQITRSLLTFARQGDGQRDLARIDEIAEGALQLVGWDFTKSGVKVVRAYHSTATIWADSGQIMQVVLNLLTNARDAMQPNGGTVTITTRELDGWVELWVEDTGSGIPENIREHIFEPFVTTKGALGGSAVAGTGLGLAVSYGIIQAHAGRLVVESTIGQGSRFMVHLPREIGQPIAPEPTPHVQPHARSQRILVVDDEAQVRSMLVALLSRAGHTVAQAIDGQDVIDRCQQEQWELIISDMTMPRLDGPDLIRQLRARGVSTPVILMTGRVDSAGLQRARSSDACAVLEKPFAAANLLAVIASAVE